MVDEKIQLKSQTGEEKNEEKDNSGEVALRKVIR